MTIEDIFRAVRHAPDDKKVETARKMLEQYEGDDKELIAPDILKSAVLTEELANMPKLTHL